jgi:hypothetical protein
VNFYDSQLEQEQHLGSMDMREEPMVVVLLVMQPV